MLHEKYRLKCNAATPARCRRRAPGKEGIMHATLSPSWKKNLLLVFVSVVAFATATPAISRPQCFFQGLGFLPGGSSSGASGVNANGTVVVGSAIDASFHGQAFRWTAASGMVGLGFLPGLTDSVANGVNADGTVVVGFSAHPRPLSAVQAFRWTAASGMVRLGFLPGGNFSDANGVNADGTVVVGHANDATGILQGFRWTAASGMVGLGFLPGGKQSFARGVNADGTVVVGSAIEASDQPQAFRWTRATRMQSVLTLLLAAKVVTMAGWRLTSANGVSADGTVIAGDGVDPLGLPQGWIARLPNESNEDCEE
jgi:probable HAF family extracellular repeat protein